MRLLVIPALDLKDGKCVQLAQGDPKRIIVSIDDPVEVALKWQDIGAPRLHLVDLDGAINGIRRNERIVRDIISQLSIPVQFGGGLRTPRDARSILKMGAARVILGTLAYEQPDVVRGLAEEFGTDRLTIALDSRRGKVAIKGWVEITELDAWDAVKNYEDVASEVLFTNVDVEGLMKGIEESIVKKLVDSTDLGVIVSGGISSLEDLEKIAAMNAKGAVIGSALYTGKINLKDAIRATS
jgi:phosphoribosylformimino-5-aminoimidazole carboxamide ribotide isomerase